MKPSCPTPQIEESMPETDRAAVGLQKANEMLGILWTNLRNCDRHTVNSFIFKLELGPETSHERQ